ncbi:hypothetical protein MUK42_11275 [Musa troglodytarum]|uniref:Uncharacterized protein n=1 Tax=Musa troglodytarum TaxID=320322 RepID=A0A9E7H8U3_9LILI|nr:hypothetical protein MUK42_11275 [Musa troglodytarum]
MQRLKTRKDPFKNRNDRKTRKTSRQESNWKARLKTKRRRKMDPKQERPRARARLKATKKTDQESKLEDKIEYEPKQLIRKHSAVSWGLTRARETLEEKPNSLPSGKVEEGGGGRREWGRRKRRRKREIPGGGDAVSPMERKTQKSLFTEENAEAKNSPEEDTAVASAVRRWRGRQPLAEETPWSSLGRKRVAAGERVAVFRARVRRAFVVRWVMGGFLQYHDSYLVQTRDPNYLDSGWIHLELN